jgi:hypothetical protein
MLAQLRNDVRVVCAVQIEFVQNDSVIKVDGDSQTKLICYAIYRYKTMSL